jgi:hypothetical protein
MICRAMALSYIRPLRSAFFDQHIIDVGDMVTELLGPPLPVAVTYSRFFLQRVTLLA